MPSDICLSCSPGKKSILPLVEGLLSSGAASPAPASAVFLKHVSPFIAHPVPPLKVTMEEGA